MTPREVALHLIRPMRSEPPMRALDDPKFVDKLTAKGLKKFIAYEVAVNEAREKYGKHYNLIMQDLHQTDDLRVLGYDGHRAFNNFNLKDLGQPICREAENKTR